jgi:uncharacterized membrane protein YfcA
MVLAAVAALAGAAVQGDGGEVRWRLIAPPLAAAVPGLVLGVVALELLSKATLQAVVGLVVVVIATHRVARRPTPSGPGRRISAAGTGLASGALSTSISVSGPPFVLWLERHGLAPGDLRATLAATFLALNLAGGVVLLIAGGIDEWLPAGTLLPLLGLVLLGHYLGAAVFRRLDSERFSLAVLGLVVIAGLASLVAGLAAL